MPMVHLQLGDASLSWKVLPAMVRGSTAALWALATDGARRRLEPWECDALFRTRLHGTHESPFSDDELLLCSAEETTEAYHRDFGTYYEEELRRPD